MRLCICVLICLSLLLSVTAFGATNVPKYHLAKTIAVGGDGGWDCLTYDGAAHRLYIARSTRVIVVDTVKDVVAGEIPNTQGVHGVAINSRLHKGFTSNGKDNSVSIFDTDTLKETSRVKVGQNPDVIIFDRASNRIFTFNGGSNDATAISADSGKVEGTIALGGKPEFAVADGSGLIFVNIEDKSEIVSFDSKTLTVKNRWPLAPGEEPSGIAFDRRNRRLFSVCSNQKMIVMDADSGKVISVPVIGRGADGAGFDPESGTAFSPNGRDGTMTMVQAEAPDKYIVAGTVVTQVSARTMAMDRRSGDIYLAAAKFAPAPPPVAGVRPQRPPVIPGSFVILVFSKLDK